MRYECTKQLLEEQITIKIMDINFEDLLNNPDFSDDNLSIEGMEDFNVEIPNQPYPEQIISDETIGSVNYLDDNGDGGSGGPVETAYGTNAFCDPDN